MALRLLPSPRLDPSRLLRSSSKARRLNCLSELPPMTGSQLFSYLLIDHVALTLPSPIRASVVAKLDQDRFAVKAWLLAGASWLAEHLDLRLPPSGDNTDETARWTLRKALFCVAGISLVLWAVAFVLFRFLFGS